MPESKLRAASAEYDAVYVNAETYFTGAWLPIETELGLRRSRAGRPNASTS